MPDNLLTALALVLIIEGLFPFISPAAWRQMFLGLLALTDGQLRFFGLCAVLLGLGGLWLMA